MRFRSFILFILIVFLSIFFIVPAVAARGVCPPGTTGLHSSNDSTNDFLAPALSAAVLLFKKYTISENRSLLSKFIYDKSNTSRILDLRGKTSRVFSYSQNRGVARTDVLKFPCLQYTGRLIL